MYFLEKKNISLEAAKLVASAALEEASRYSWNICVAVVDSSGELVVLEKQDKAIGISPQVAMAKAKTAALLQSPSKEFEEFINSGKPSFLSTPGVTALEGGVPITMDSQVIGAVGISGAHGINDTQVAEYAANLYRDITGLSKSKIS